MYGQMAVGASEQARMTVPVSSVFTAQGKSFLFVHNANGAYERREVLLGAQGADWIEVLQGVATGERVVAKGAMLLKSLSFGY
jgi:cobalt-zinc-cadmium efflux system membrane fusion protein